MLQDKMQQPSPTPSRGGCQKQHYTLGVASASLCDVSVGVPGRRIKSPELFLKTWQLFPNRSKLFQKNQNYSKKNSELLLKGPKLFIKKQTIYKRRRPIHKRHCIIHQKTQNYPWKQQATFIKQVIQGIELVIQLVSDQNLYIKVRMTHLFIKNKTMLIQQSMLAPWRARLTCTNLRVSYVLPVANTYKTQLCPTMPAMSVYPLYNGIHAGGFLGLIHGY